MFSYSNGICRLERPNTTREHKKKNGVHSSTPFSGVSRSISSQALEYGSALPYLLMKFANPVPGCVISGPVRYHISPDLGLKNGL